jgi:Aspartyl/Asparaginyl beta-hydroxylase
MKNFALVKSNIDTSELLETLTANNHLWNQLDLRKLFETAHRQVDDIIVRSDDLLNYSSGMDCVDYQSRRILGNPLDNAINLVMSLVDGQKLGRVVITRIKPTLGVGSHIDHDKSAQYYKRYHLCLKGQTGNTFTSGDESVDMLTGELWWFDNTIPHHCVNNSGEERIHLIMDIISACSN